MQSSNGPIPDRPPAAVATDHPFHTGIRQRSVARFLVMVIVFLVTEPFIDQLAASALIESVLVTLLLLSAVTAVGGRRKTFIAAVVLVTPALLGKWLQHFRSDWIAATFTYVTAIVFVAFVIAQLFRYILRAPRVNTEILCAAVAGYLLLGILWAFGYLLLSRLDPRSFLFNGEAGRDRPMVSFEALFLSFGTFSNVGYGEVSAVSKAARMLMMAQAMTGAFYLALLLARLVGIYSGDEAAPAEQDTTRDDPTAPGDLQLRDATH